MSKIYAIRKGHKTGIFNSWDECKKNVSGFSGAEYKSFKNIDDAYDYLDTKKTSENTQSEAYAYVDGSYSHDQLKFSFGAVLFYKGEELHFNECFSDPILVSMRNVAGEIKGSEFIMNYCFEHSIKSIDLYYDYEGIEKWCTGAWKANKIGTQNYVQLYKKISKSVDINFIKVKGHSGDKYNDLADQLAKSALGI